MIKEHSKCMHLYTFDQNEKDKWDEVKKGMIQPILLREYYIDMIEKILHVLCDECMFKVTYMFPK